MTATTAENLTRTARLIASGQILADRVTPGRAHLESYYNLARCQDATGANPFVLEHVVTRDEHGNVTTAKLA